MSKLRIHCFAISLDGYGAGPNQSLENPLGVGGLALHQWAFATRTFQRMFGNGRAARPGPMTASWCAGFDDVGAWILGRNMFGPVRGPWPDDAWKGWWGDSPPYHVPVFVLTHHARAPIAMEGGTTFHFVTDGIERALERARDAAGDRTSGSAAASPRSDSISRPVSSTRCTSPSRPSCSAPASPSSPASTCRNWAIG